MPDSTLRGCNRYTRGSVDLLRTSDFGVTGSISELTINPLNPTAHLACHPDPTVNTGSVNVANLYITDTGIAKRIISASVEIQTSDPTATPWTYNESPTSISDTEFNVALRETGGPTPGTGCGIIRDAANSTGTWTYKWTVDLELLGGVIVTGYEIILTAPSPFI